MKMKLTLTAFLLLYTYVYAEKLDNKNNNKQTIERGWHYQEGSDNVEPDKEDKKNRSTNELLEEILKVQKEQLKVQKNIERMLQSKLDPKPQKFINEDGKECVENESAECYKYPILPDGKRQPVLSKFLQNPTVENAIEYKKWEDRHFNHVEDIGYSMKYAIFNNQDKSKTLIDSTSMLSGKYNRYLTQAMADKIKQHSDSIKIYILMSEDGREYLNIRKGISKSIEYLKASNIKPEIVFKDENSHKAFKDVLNKYDSMVLKEFESLEPTIIISPKTHSAIKPIAYPTYILKYNDEKNSKEFMQIFGAGNSQNSDFIRNLYEILVLEKVVNRAEINNEILQEYEFKEFKNQYIDLKEGVTR